jgi:galactitol-specific phosphotransferase system IIB component
MRAMSEEGKELGTDNVLDKALHDLEIAESQLAKTRVEEAAAEGNVADAIEEIKHAEHERNFVTVHVIHVNEVEKASFKEKLAATLQQVWDKSYVELKIPRKPKDVFQTAGKQPKSLMSYLGLTLEQARQQKIIEDFCFGIASETGGA